MEYQNNAQLRDSIDDVQADLALLMFVNGRDCDLSDAVRCGVHRLLNRAIDQLEIVDKHLEKSNAA